MRARIFIAVTSLLLGCVHQPTSGSSIARNNEPPNIPATAMPGQLDPATKAQKQECEKLLNAVLPFVEAMLSDRRQLFPFAGALTSSGQLVLTGRYDRDKRPLPRNAVAVLETGLQQGAKSGRYKATALVLDMLVVPPNRNVRQHAIAIRLDHRGGYSVVVFYPYDLGDSGSLAIGAPFSEWGEKKIYSR